jgi:predicted nuclease with TOPRIM domain
MSTDRTAEMLNYLSAISRDVGELRKEMGELRAEMNARFTEINSRLERVERELRQQGRRLDRIESIMLKMRADVDELDERVEALEGKRA